MAASFLLFISAALGLAGGKPGEDSRAIGLLERGWQKTDRLPCANAQPGRFYELEGETEAVEVYVVSAGNVLAASLPLPSTDDDHLASCREIAEPHFIQEIR